MYFMHICLTFIDYYSVMLKRFPAKQGLPSVEENFDTYACSINGDLSLYLGVSSLNILVVHPLYAGSHVLTLHTLSKELLANGHKVSTFKVSLYLSVLIHHVDIIFSIKMTTCPI
jgi:hypothetical protein